MFRLLWPIVLLVACAAPTADLTLAPDVDGFSAALHRVDHDLAATAALDATDWTVQGRLAGLHLQRARLAGGYADYDHALLALDRAYAQAAPGAGPHQTHARVLASLHRLPEAIDAVDRARDRILIDDVTTAELDLLRAELAWQQGDYPTALDASAELELRRPTWRTASTGAHHAWHTLQDAEAERAWDLAEQRLVGEQRVARAWLHLQRGLLDLDRGRPDEALHHYLDADAALPGWWLVHEHVAEALVLTGHPDQAEPIYRDVVEHTDAPEFMDALAGLALDRGDRHAADAWIARAEARYEDQLAAHPEAAAGHALGHYLDFGPADRAVELARANLAARPNAEAHTWLALALLHADRPDEAREHVTAALATPWRSGDLLALAAELDVGE